MKIKVFILLLIMCFLNLGMANASSFKTNAKTKRIPAGTKLQFKMLNTVSTISDQEGNAFSAVLIGDQTSETSVILPTGSIVRGTIRELIPSKRLSRGAVLYLDFDHIVTPTGRQMPLSMTLHNRTDLTYDGGLNVSKGYGDALKQNWANTVDIAKTATEWGVDTGNNAFPGAVIITAPIGALGGFLGGTGYIIGDSVADLFRKGPEVTISKDSILDVMLAQPIDVPIN